MKRRPRSSALHAETENSVTCGDGPGREGGLLLVALLVRHLGLDSLTSAVRRGRQAVWVGLGLVLLWVLGARRATETERVEPAEIRGD